MIDQFNRPNLVIPIVQLSGLPNQFWTSRDVFGSCALSRKGAAMGSKELENRLEYGEQWGFIKPTDSADYLGWVLLSKRKPAAVTPLDPVQDYDRFVKWSNEVESLRQRPYLVKVLELDRAVHESGEYESTEDYRVIESHHFATLAEAESFIRELGNSFADIKNRLELDAP